MSDTPNTKIYNEYKKQYDMILSEIKILESEINNHWNEFSKSVKRDWGYVGDLGHVHERLKEINDFLKK